MPQPRLMEHLALLITVLVIIGYPLVGMVASLVNAESNLLTYSYRAFVLALSVIAILSVFFRPIPGRIDGWLMFFLLAYAVRLSYDAYVSENPEAQDALLFFTVAVFFPVLACMIYRVSSFSDTLVARSILGIGLLVQVLAVVAYVLDLGYNPWADQGIETTRLGFEKLNSISLGHAAGTTLICALYLILKTRLGFLMRITAWVALAISTYVILVANSRGPFIATGAAMAWFFLSRMRLAVYVAPVFLLLVSIVSTDNPLIANVFERFEVDFSIDGSIAARLAAQQLAIDAFLEEPVFGSHFLDPVLGAGSYPHNVFIETAMALGIFGLILVLIIMARAGRKIFTFFNAQHPLLVMLLIKAVVAGQFSGNLWGSDSLYLLLALTLTGVRRRKVTRVESSAVPLYQPGFPPHSQVGLNPDRFQPSQQFVNDDARRGF